MTTKTKELETKFNKAFPEIKQAGIGKAQATQFNKKRFLKAAKELRQVVKKNDKNDPAQR